MNEVKQLSSSAEPRDGIEDAEFEEIGIEHNASRSAQPSRPPDYTISEWLAEISDLKKLVLAGMISGLGLFYLFLVLPHFAAASSRTSEEIPLSKPLPTAVAPDAKKTPSPEWLTGSWILTPKGGEDGRTSCDAFSARSLYRLNGKTGQVVTFVSSGEYRDLFIYTTPSAQEHYTITKARWSLDGPYIHFTEGSSHDAFDVSWGSRSDIVTRKSDNVMMRDNGTGQTRFVRCIGDTSEMYGE